MPEMPTHRRSPLVSILIFGVGLTASLLLVALLQLDIGAYKQQLAAHLERTLNKPVRLGDAELSFHGGIALDFRNLQIGDDDSFSLHVPQLSAILEPMGLLRGEIVIEQILLGYPSLKLGLPLKPAKSTIDLDRLGLKTLQIRKGSLTIFYPDGETKPLRVENFNLVMHGLGKGLVSQLVTTATLFQSDRNTDLKASVELTRQQIGQPWRQGSLRGNISLSNLRRRLLGNWEITELPEIFDLALDLEGIPSGTVKLKAALNDSSSGNSLLSLASDWQSSQYDDSFSNLKLGLAGVPLTGHLRLDRRGAYPQLTGQLELGRTELRTLMLAARQHPLRDLSGQITEMQLNFNGSLHATEENPFSPLQRAFLKLDNLDYSSGALKLADARLSLELQNGRLDLSDAQGHLVGIPFTATGSSGRLDENPTHIDLQANAEINLQHLQSRFTAPYWKRQTLKGKIPLSLKLQGPLNRIATEFQANLTQTSLVISKLIDKKHGAPLQIGLRGLLMPNNFTLDSAQISLGENKLETTGELSLKNNRWAGTLLLKPVNTSILQPDSPIFDFFKIAGQVQGRVEFGSSRGVAGRFEIKDAGAHLTRVLGDINRVNGSINLDRNGLDLGTLEARIGKSPVKISGNLVNWRSPLLNLHVTGKKIRAQDLIFTNRQMVLKDLDGHIQINAGGILFEQIRVKIGDKTKALVQGQMRTYRNPQTYLEIDAEDAEILDIIKLFSGPPRSFAPPRPGFSPSLQIQARVKKGTIDGLAFTDAVGTIDDRKQVFTVEPLRFKIGQGTAVGRVEFDRKRSRLLKVSGHVENFDVEPLYQHFFKTQGILQGRLSGDIYLEGESGLGHFWETSNGGAHLDISQGVLRKLHGLAQIFSILNVTQLFKFKMPDIDKEGMPFSLLSVSPRMEKGVLIFNDLQINSPAINMSVVGQLNSLEQSVDLTVGIKPLRTVDILLEKIPLIGWILTGKEKALITALFTVKGPIDDSKVKAVPVSTVSSTILGIIGRTLTLPVKLIQDTDKLLNTPSRPGDEGSFPEQENDH